MTIQYDSPNLRVFESALYRTTATVWQTPDLVLAVDPNWLPAEVLAIQQFIQEVRQKRPLYLLFTHADYDHIIGYGAFPKARVIASQAFAEKADKAQVVQQIIDWDAGFYIARPYEIAYPEVDIVVKEDGATLSIGSTHFTFYLAPGHTEESIFTIGAWQKQRIWLLGDYLSNIEFPFIYDHLEAYEQTLAKAEQIRQNWGGGVAIPGHGDATEDPIDIQSRIKAAQDYLQMLRWAVQNGETFPDGALWERYTFRKGMELEHAANLALAQKELLV